ncbi:MAG TPA: TonB-dependent receptor [Albitalea sp.]|uniref:TonB-dependent receptor plug domain-containing protein n=1 Tax=Piscinibacter sp. TaxID=1903157 RepID=UPI002ED4BD7A
MTRVPSRSLAAVLFVLAVSPAAAQVEPPAAQASAPARLERVEITGGRAGDTEQRRQSTAAKIVIGRDEIERFGDSTVGEVLKRLPGVTLQGAPGRGGAIRLRGLGGGYTQILLDGERVPPGFSLDTLVPEQIERIEILRAPTAETGTRAIAGTVNIVLREGFRKRLNELKLTLDASEANVEPHVAWTRNETIGDWTINVSPSVYLRTRDGESVTTTERRSLADGSVQMAQSEATTTHDRRKGLHLTSRLQWRGDRGEVTTWTPFLLHITGPTRGESVLTPSVVDPARPTPYERAAWTGDARFTLARLNAQWNRRLSDATRLEWRGSVGRAHAVNNTRREEFVGDQLSRSLDEGSDVRDDSASAGIKASTTLAESHSLVSGAEVEATRRREQRRPELSDFADTLSAGSTRIAAYAQDEWSPTARWALHAGLRWEGIATRGEGEHGVALHNRSSVWTPLAHAVWKPDPASRDQLRMSLTRSYRAPPLQSLIARPSVNSRYAASGTNAAAFPDRAGNPELRPELATGIDLAVERYLPGGGLLSANLFHRRIRDLIRTLTTLEDVSWSPVPRWVARPRNVGDAMTQGLELEAKFRASDVWADALPLDLRANLSLFRSRVDGVPGPDNRLDQQPGATANLGVDYRFRGLPLTVGANLNWTPGYDTRLSDTQWATQGRKRVIDATAVWTFDPDLRLRVTASNVAPLEYVTGSAFIDDGAQEMSRTTARSFVNWQIRLEMKL